MEGIKLNKELLKANLTSRSLSIDDLNHLYGLLNDAEAIYNGNYDFQEIGAILHDTILILIKDLESRFKPGGL